MSKNQSATAIKVAEPEIERESEAVEAPSRRATVVHLSLALNFLLVAVMGGLAYFHVRTQNQMRTELRAALGQAATEMESLRADVVMTTSENSIFLKTMLLKPGIDKGLARDIAHSVVLRAREHGRDPDLVLAIIAVESNFNPNAVSYAGAMGLMQIMPMWKQAFGIELDLRHIDTSINYGLKILGSYEQTFGSLELALTAYNRGPQGVSNDLGRGRVPFNGYAENIMRTYARIKAWTRP